jgi:hypothetical protein
MTRNAPFPPSQQLANTSGHKKLHIDVYRDNVYVWGRSIKDRHSVIAVEVTPVEARHIAAKIMHPLIAFDLAHHQYILHFSKGLIGEVRYRGKMRSFEELKSTGATAHSSEHLWTLPLHQSSKGHFVIGPYQVRFHFAGEEPLTSPPKPVSERAFVIGQLGLDLFRMFW